MEQTLPPVLELACYELAEEIRRGEWQRVAGHRTQPITEVREILAEIERRCPGYDFAQYTGGLGHGMYLTR